jgi:hypothetical protein
MRKGKEKKENRDGSDVSPFGAVKDRDGAEAKDRHRIQFSEMQNCNFHPKRAASSQGARIRTLRRF